MSSKLAIAFFIGLLTIIAGVYFSALVQLPMPEIATTTLPYQMATSTLETAATSTIATSTTPLKALPAKISEKSTTASPKPIIATTSALSDNFFTAPASLLEKNIDIQTIVLVRCLFRSQYFKDSTQPWAEQQYNVGSGAIVSPKGYILTARHILEVSRELLNDPAGRVWSLQKCDVAQTDKIQTEIPSINFWGAGDDPQFKISKIIFKPADEEYRESAGLDFAILKIDSEIELPYVKLLPKLVALDKKAPIIAIGYPGRESVSPQKLERFDGEFIGITYYKESVCDGSIKPCGLRYGFRRYPFDYEKDFWKPTEFGIITPYFRKGFSGTPAFFKGNLIGIVTHGESGDQTESHWDEAFILTSYDISEKLKALLD